MLTASYVCLVERASYWTLELVLRAILALFLGVGVQFVHRDISKSVLQSFKAVSGYWPEEAAPLVPKYYH